MAIQEYVSGEELKSLVQDKIVNSSSLKYVLKSKGVFPICTKVEDLASSMLFLFFGSSFMTQIHDVMNFEQNNLKSTIAVIAPKGNQSEEAFLTEILDDFSRLQRIPNIDSGIKNIIRNENQISLQYYYDKRQRGKISMASRKEVFLDISIVPLKDKQYKVSIKHEGMSDSKRFVSLLENMANTGGDDGGFKLRRIALQSLLNTHKVDFFDFFGNYKHKDWKLDDITNVTVNKDEKSIDEEDDGEQELVDIEPAGKQTGISSAILTGAGLRKNEFVKDCMKQGFIFSSMRYRFEHVNLPIIIEIDVNFRQKDLKINMAKMFELGEDDRQIKTIFPSVEQEEYLDYFQDIAYGIYSELINKQKSELEEQSIFPM